MGTHRICSSLHPRIASVSTAEASPKVKSPLGPLHQPDASTLQCTISSTPPPQVSTTFRWVLPLRHPAFSFSVTSSSSPSGLHTNAQFVTLEPGFAMLEWAFGPVKISSLPLVFWASYPLTHPLLNYHGILIPCEVSFYHSWLWF